MKCVLVLYLFMFVLWGNLATGDDAPQVSFRSDIAPILLDSCLACHGAKKAEGGYRVDSYSELLKAGDSGETPVANTADESSELLRRIACQDASERMPAESEPLTAEQIELVKRWIADGAKFDGSDPSLSLALVIPPVQYADPPEVYRHALPIAATAFSPDGKSIVTGGYHELIVWSAEDGQLMRRIKNVGQRVFALEFSADGGALAVGCGEPGRSGEVRIIDFLSGQIQSVSARTHDVVLDVAYRPGTNELAVASADSSIRIVDMQTLAEVRTIASHADWVTAVSWSEDGTRLASASRDKSAKVYDGGTGELVASYLGHGAAVRGVTILKDGHQVISVGADNKAHRWEIAGAKKVAEVPLGGEGYQVIRQGDQVLVPCADKRLLQINLTNNTIAQAYQGHNDWVLSVSVQRKATETSAQPLIVSGAFDGELRLWNVADATLVRSWIAKP